MKTIIFCLLFLASCSTYTPPSAYRFDSEKVFIASKDKIWDKTMQFLLRYKMFPTFTEKASGIIRYEGDFTEFQGIIKHEGIVDKRLERSILDCGTLGLTKNPQQYKDGEIIIYITEDEKSCNVQVQCKRISVDALKRDVQCVSTGVFEKEIFAALATVTN